MKLKSSYRILIKRYGREESDQRRKIQADTREGKFGISAAGLGSWF